MDEALTTSKKPNPPYLYGRIILGNMDMIISNYQIWMSDQATHTDVIFLGEGKLYSEKLDNVFTWIYSRSE